MQIGKSQAIEMLQTLLDAVPQLPIQGIAPVFKDWHAHVESTLNLIFGGDQAPLLKFHNIRFAVTRYTAPTSLEAQHRDEAEDAHTMENALREADTLLRIFQQSIAVTWEEDPTEPGGKSFTWGIIHPDIARVSRGLFESGHYAEAAFTAMVEVNAVLKAMVKALTGDEYDGTDLSHRAFSPNRPILELGDLTTETGRNMQQGFMQIFSGSMLAIRNPKAHGNIPVDENRAIHFLFLASLLMHKIDEAQEAP